MRVRFSRPRPWMGVVTVVLLLVGGVAATNRLWLPWARTQLSGGLSDKNPSLQRDVNKPLGHGHTHGHSHAGHSEDTSIELSQSGLKNIGFEPMVIERSMFTKTVTLPGMVVERPGRSQIHVTAPLTGIVTKIHPIEGAAVEPGSPLFEVRLTHEELVTAQRDFLRTVESLDVVDRETSRLKSLSEGLVAGRRILEQEYEKQKLEASLRAERQALRLHGLSEEQIETILRDRQLFQSATVRAPVHSDENESCREDHLFHVQQLPVKLGQQVEAGEVLCVLADHCELYVEGRAFEDDAAGLREAARQGWSVAASLLVGERKTDVVEGLKLLYLADHVDPQSRAFRFYLSLPNQIALDQPSPDGHSFIEWRFKPGQRMELRVPVEHWEDRIVLPVGAIVQEGAEAYVYRQNDVHFDRVPVHVEYRDQASVVIGRDGSLLPGDVVAARGAYQMHLALKNKTGGGVDPHAGHSH